jgi:hypothetical protein
MKNTEGKSFTEGQCSTGWGRWNAGVMKAMGDSQAVIKVLGDEEHGGKSFT